MLLAWSSHNWTNSPRPRGCWVSSPNASPPQWISYGGTRRRRVAAAICAVLLGDQTADLGALLRPIAAMFRAGEHGPVPGATTNAMHALRSLYVALGNDLVHPETGEPARIPGSTKLQHEIAAVLAPTTPWLFSATGGSTD